MSLSRLLPVLRSDRAVDRLLTLAGEAGAHPFVDATVAEGARPALIASLVGPLGAGSPTGVADSEAGPRPVVSADDPDRPLRPSARSPPRRHDRDDA